MTKANQKNLADTAKADPLDSMPSEARSAIKRRKLAVALTAAAGVAGLSAFVTNAAMAPQVRALESQALSSTHETVTALDDIARLESEVEELRLVQQYSTSFRIPADLAQAIREAADREDLDLDIAFRLVATESSFRKRAISPVGAIGYTQVMPTTAAWLEPGVTEGDLFDRDTNLRLGFRYLRMLIDQYDDERLALLAYNRGPGAVSRIMASGGDPANGYARQILGSE